MTWPAMTVTSARAGAGRMLATRVTTTYRPGGRATLKRPCASEVVRAISAPPASRTTIVPSNAESGQGEPMRSTGHLGPMVATPAMPVVTAGGAGGVAVVAAGGVCVAVAARVASGMGDGLECAGGAASPQAARSAGSTPVRSKTLRSWRMSDGPRIDDGEAGREAPLFSVEDHESLSCGEAAASNLQAPR